MRFAPAVVTSLLLLTALAATPYAVQAQGSKELAGGWIVSGRTAPDGTANPQPQRGLFLFTEQGHYSFMYVPGREPRALFAGDQPTDAEMLAAYQSINANSGRYTVEGDRITFDAFVAKNPNYMAGWNLETRENARTVTFRMTDGNLIITYESGAFVTLRRPVQPTG